MADLATSTALYRTFVSCGSTFTAEQKDFVAAVETYLKAKGCENFTVGKHNFSSRQPVQFARDLMLECDCAVIIAFERFRILSGMEKPDSAEEAAIGAQMHPTVWNQLEGAMAYAHDLPILVLVQKGLHRQGILSKRFEWNALEVEISPHTTQSEPFRQAVDDWIRRVARHKSQHLRKKLDLDSHSFAEIIGSLKPAQIWSILGGLLAVLSAVATAAYHIGQSTHP